MTKLHYPLLLIALGALLPTSVASAAEVHVTVRGATSPSGDIRAAFCTEREFGGLHCGRSARASVRGTTALLSFEAPPGRYAIAVFRDRFADGRIHRFFLGLPKQGVGFSRNPVLLGAPSFSRAAFDLTDAGKTLAINLCFEPVRS